MISHEIQDWPPCHRPCGPARDEEAHLKALDPAPGAAGMMPTAKRPSVQSCTAGTTAC